MPIEMGNIFTFDSNDMKNITFTFTGGEVPQPVMKKDIFNYVTFNNTFYGVSSNPIIFANNTNITIECVFRYTGGTGVILANIGQRQINTGWHDSFIEVSAINGENCILVGMWPMHLSNKPNNNINLGKLTINTWYQVILSGSNTKVSGVLNTISQSNIKSGSIDIKPQNPQFYQLYYYLGIGCTDSTSLYKMSNSTITGFVGDISYINVYNGVKNVDAITRKLATPLSTNYFQLKNKTKNKCIYNNSDKTDITDCNDNINQIWQFNPKNDGYYGFQLKNMNTNKCLFYNNDDDDGSLGSSDCNNNKYQTCNLIDRGELNFQLLNKNSDKCLLIGNNNLLNFGFCSEINWNGTDQLWNLEDKTVLYNNAKDSYDNALNAAQQAAQKISQLVIDINICKTQINAILTTVQNTASQSQKSTDIAAIEKANIANNQVKSYLSNVNTELSIVNTEVENVNSVSLISDTQVSIIRSLQLSESATASGYAALAVSKVLTTQASVTRAQEAVLRALEYSKSAAKSAAIAVVEQANQDALRAQNAATRSRYVAKDAQDAATDAENNAQRAVSESRRLTIRSITENAQIATEAAGKTRNSANIAIAAANSSSVAANSSSAAAALALTKQRDTENAQREPDTVAALATVVATANNASSFLPTALSKLNEAVSSSNTALKQSQLAISEARNSEIKALASINALEKRSNEVIKDQEKLISNINKGISISSIISSSNTTPTQTSQTMETTQQSRSNFANINENNSIMFSPNGNPEINNYINSYNKSIALLEDPNQMSKVAFDTYMHIQNKKLKELNKNLDALNKNTTKSVYPIKAIKSMSNSKILNVEAYPDPTANNGISSLYFGNSSKTYPNYLIYGNNGCLQYNPESNISSLSSPSPTVNGPASWAFKSCDSNNPNQQFSVNQINTILQYNAPITNINNASHLINDSSSTQFGFYTVNPNSQTDQCLQLNNDGISIMPCNMDASQKFKPAYHSIMD